MSLDFNLAEAPKTERVVATITELVDYITSNEEIIKLRLTNYEAFEKKISDDDRFKQFIDEYYNLFRMLVSPNPPPVEIMEMFIAYMAKVETGRMTQKQADEEIAEYMNERFIYSKFGGKENFEKEIIRRHKKELQDKRRRY